MPLVSKFTPAHQTLWTPQRVPIRIDPSWLLCDLSTEASRGPPLNGLNGGIYLPMAEALRDITMTWTTPSFSEVLRSLRRLESVFDPSQPEAVPYFVALGGIRLFVQVICDPVNLSERGAATAHSYFDVIAWALRSMAELLVCHSEIGWYLYDLYPGLIWRLLELFQVPRLAPFAGAFLERIISSVGPVIEIAKSPLLISLIRTSQDAIFAQVCRIVALLVVPAMGLGGSTISARRLTHPESMMPMKRVQRVIDSNVLWLIGEDRFMPRLLALCECRAVGLRVQQGNRTMTLMESNLTDTTTLISTLLQEYNRTGGAAAPPDMESDEANPSVPTTLEERAAALLQRGSREDDWETESAYEEESVGVSYEEGAPPRDRGDDAGEVMLDQGQMLRLQEVLGSFEFPPNASAGQRLDSDAASSILRQMADEQLLQPPEDVEDNSKLDLSWFFGTADACQRWRLRDCTLLEGRDDNRSRFLPVWGGNDELINNFRLQNEQSLKSMQMYARDQHDPLMTSQQVIVDSQSELLFVLNVILSTFCFGEAWKQLRDERWLKRAIKIYDVAFGLDQQTSMLIDVPIRITLAPHQRALPRFLPAASSQTMHAVDAAHDGAPPLQWCSSTFLEQLGSYKEAFTTDASTEMFLENDEDVLDDKATQHGPDTIRKLELVRSILEYWNCQDCYEIAMVRQSPDAVGAASSLTKRIATTLTTAREGSCVETTACRALETYLRCFVFTMDDEEDGSSPSTNPSTSLDDSLLTRSCPQTDLGDILLKHILEERLYNGTLIPGLPGTITSLKRMDGFLALLAELIRYHYPNFHFLLRYVNDSESLTHLNVPRNDGASGRILLSDDDTELARVMNAPPLERMEHEAFASVLMRRIYFCGSEANLFIRALVLSLTPGLRSSVNYYDKEHPEPIRSPTETFFRVGDVIAGYSIRLTRIRSLSREYVRRIGISMSSAQTTEAIHGRPLPETTVNLLENLMGELQTLPHRLPLDRRPFPHLYTNVDRLILRGEHGLPELGPPASRRRAIFGSAIPDDSAMENLRPVADRLLGEPHKLIYSLLCGVHAENMSSLTRLGAITTSVLIFMREAVLRGGESGVHNVLAALHTVAEPAFRKCREDSKRVEQERNEKGGPTAPFCTCAPAGHRPVYRCTNFLIYGSCHPPNEAAVYHRTVGGCFFRNFMRLLCVWVGHYWACQRYVETLYCGTEIPFAEFKSMVMYLLHVLPHYFFQSEEIK